MGWEAGIWNGNGNKPEGLRWRTFERVQAARDAYVNQALAGMPVKLGLAIGQLGSIKT